MRVQPDMEKRGVRDEKDEKTRAWAMGVTASLHLVASHC